VNLAVVLDMVAEGMPDRVLVGGRRDGLTAGRLRAAALTAARHLVGRQADRLVFLGSNGPAFPVALFAAALAGVPFLPLNYRLSDEQLGEILARQAGASLIVTDTPERVGPAPTIGTSDLLTLPEAETGVELPPFVDPESVAVLLMTSGTTAAPKSAVLRHRHLAAYIFGSVEFASVPQTDATLVSVPPYHVAAVANALSNLYCGRRVVYLEAFTPEGWLATVEREGISHAMVVPTMLVRIVDVLRDRGQEAPGSLRSISYGGAKISTQVVQEALRLFPGAGFVNAYGLTETASSIAVLGPEDHRLALADDDPAVRARLGSVGRPLPTVEIEVRDARGRSCPAGEVGDIVVRGDQVAGEYLETAGGLTADGWFATRDRGYLDDGGYLFVRGRADDTIIRGGENIAPAEIEDVLARHPAVLECAVAGVPDVEWGQRIGAFVVSRPGTTADPDQLRAWVRERLRGSRTPDDIVFVTDLPTTATGKVLRRELVAQVQAGADARA
jgi:acyl-CoA synthetase (AMP-forming)/AMP-acid ligase II